MATFNHFKTEEKYRCKCGKEFENSQSFNAHKGHCIIHLGEDKYNARLAQQKANLLKGNETQKQLAKIKQETELQH